ncbi:MAG: sigma-54 dependent transcriptional regulator [Pseudomonadota bacterium]
MSLILFVDDDATTRSQLKQALEESGHEVLVAASGDEAIARLPTADLDLVISDLRMGTVDGLAVLDAVRSQRPETPVVILTGQGSIDTAVEAMRRGAVDYLTKPVNLDRLDLVIVKALASRRLLRENAELRRQLAGRGGLRPLLGGSLPMQRLKADIDRIAGTVATVLLLGESGTGKELAAEAIHRNSSRAEHPLIKVNCAALSEGLLESELFGHERGAYTGAHRSREGRFEAAEGGSIFLDEIGDLSVASQLKLLRVLQERTVERVGANATIPVDVRVIAATNKDLQAAVRDGSFREELYYRLSVVTLRLPALRDRHEDLELLLEAFLQEFNAIHGRQVQRLSGAALQRLRAYAWPGNVRELRNCMESLVVMARGESIELADLPDHLRATEAGTDQFSIPLGRTLDDVEREYILRTLSSVVGNKARAARVLGIGAKTLYRKLHDYGFVFEDRDG